MASSASTVTAWPSNIPCTFKCTKKNMQLYIVLGVYDQTSFFSKWSIDYDYNYNVMYKQGVHEKMILLHCKNKRVALIQLGVSQLQVHYQKMCIQADQLHYLPNIIPLWLL